MLLSTLKQFNWVDIFVVILLLKTCYIAMKNGFSIELFKLLGTVLATYLSLHYYLIFSDYIGSRIGVNNIPLAYLTSLIFVVLAILGYLVFVVLRIVFYRFIKMEAVPNLNKWGGLIFGLARGVLLVSLIIFILVRAPFGYLKGSVTGSYSGKRLFKIAPSVYSGLWNNIASKFITQEKYNQAILEVPRSLESEK